MIRFLVALSFGIGLQAPLAAFSSQPKGPLGSLKRIIELSHGSGAVEFDAIGRPGALKIHGKGAAPRGTLTIEGNNVAGLATFDLQSLDTGISLRNEHMKKKYLEVDKFPEAKLKIVKVELPKDFDPLQCKLEGVPFEGTLNLHGVEKPVKGTAKLDCGKEKIDFKAWFALIVEDFGIAVPSFAGVTMTKEVKVAIEASAPFTKN